MRDGTRFAIIIIIVFLIIGLLFVCGCTKRGLSGGPSSTPSPKIVATTGPAVSPAEKTPTSALSDVKVAVLYERVTDGVIIGRSASDTAKIIKDTDADMVFRGFMRWQAVPESPGASLKGYSSSYVSSKANIGYTYSQLQDAISEIKKESPKTLFIGAIAAQRINRLEVDDKTGDFYDQSQTWAMAFDPAKYNLPAGTMGATKEEYQCNAAKGLGWIPSSTSCPSGYNPNTAEAYFPDITNEQYQQLLVNRAKKQIDLGADGIWIDMLFGQSNYAQQATNGQYGPAFTAAYDASSKVIDEIHAYGKSKGKDVIVGSWATFAQYDNYKPATWPAADFVTVSTSATEIKNGIDTNKWKDIKSSLSSELGNTPVYTFIDWNGGDAGENAQMGIFSQETPDKQRAWLENADAVYTKVGIIFAYPVHGGVFSTTAKTLTFGKYNVYDSLAPQFNTYDTIKTLALKKSGS